MMTDLPAMPPVSRLAAVRASLRRSRPATLPEETLVVRAVRGTVAHLSAYNRVCGFRLGDRLPITYPHVLAFPLAMRLMTDPDFPFPAAGTVHIGNALWQRRPLLIDEPIDLSIRAIDLRPHDRGRQFDLVTTATVDGEDVWRDTSTYLRRESRSRQESEPRSGSEPPDRPSALWRVPREIGKRYADVSGDHNPIHTSRLGARAFGFPKPIAHGMWTMARAVAALEGRLPPAYTVEVAFKRPILLGSTVAFRSDREGSGWHLRIWSPASGKPHLTGTVTA